MNLSFNKIMENIFENQKFIVANFKQSGDLNFFTDWISKFKSEIEKIDLNLNIVLCPSFPYLNLLSESLKSWDHKNSKKVFLGSQNVSSYTNLENTGEVGAQSLKDFVQFSIIGHSERKENYDEIFSKYQRCIENQIIPIVCFYENLKVYNFENCLFAYEDPKAISKEGVYAEKNFDEVLQITNKLSPLFQSKNVLYGGSVKEDNLESIINLNFFKGVLVGRSSLDPFKFCQIVKVLNQ